MSRLLIRAALPTTAGLEREHIHLALIDEATRGIVDVNAGRTMSVAEVRAK